MFCVVTYILPRRVKHYKTIKVTFDNCYCVDVNNCMEQSRGNPVVDEKNLTDINVGKLDH